jgi:signal transduction histidine kinase
MNKVNILVVDDQPSKLVTYQAILTDLGENVILARSGREALHHLLRGEFALILLDVVMPEMDGFETATIIRQHPRLERTPIVFVTALSTSDLDHIRGYQLGAVDYVFVPIIPQILRAKVAVFVELYRKERELSEANARLHVEIAERKRAEEQALQSERLAAIGQMVTGLAHESRNALQQIQSSVEMLARRVGREPEQGLIHEIQKAQDRLYRLFEEVRSYAAPIQLERETRDLADIWHEAWRQLAAQHRDRRVTFREVHDGIDRRCTVDVFSMERVFRNILENSLAACADPVSITIHCAHTEFEGHPALEVLIRDNGPGLNEEQRRNIFVPFFTTKSRGTGLGMAIAKRIVEAHGGRIAVGDPNHPGVEISILLPRGTP